MSQFSCSYISGQDLSQLGLTWYDMIRNIQVQSETPLKNVSFWVGSSTRLSRASKKPGKSGSNVYVFCRDFANEPFDWFNTSYFELRGPFSIQYEPRNAIVTFSCETLTAPLWLYISMTKYYDALQEPKVKQFLQHGPISPQT